MLGGGGAPRARRPLRLPSAAPGLRALQIGARDELPPRGSGNRPRGAGSAASLRRSPACLPAGRGQTTPRSPPPPASPSPRTKQPRDPTAATERTFFARVCEPFPPVANQRRAAPFLLPPPPHLLPPTSGLSIATVTHRLREPMAWSGAGRFPSGAGSPPLRGSPARPGPARWALRPDGAGGQPRRASSGVSPVGFQRAVGLGRGRGCRSPTSRLTSWEGLSTASLA